MSDYSKLADFIVKAPCHWCKADIYNKEQHKEGCRMSNNHSDLIVIIDRHDVTHTFMQVKDEIFIRLKPNESLVCFKKRAEVLRKEESNGLETRTKQDWLE